MAGYEPLSYSKDLPRQHPNAAEPARDLRELLQPTSVRQNARCTRRKPPARCGYSTTDTTCTIPTYSPAPRLLHLLEREERLAPMQHQRHERSGRSRILATPVELRRPKPRRGHPVPPRTRTHPRGAGTRPPGTTGAAGQCQRLRQKQGFTPSGVSWQTRSRAGASPKAGPSPTRDGPAERRGTDPEPGQTAPPRLPPIWEAAALRRQPPKGTAVRNGTRPQPVGIPRQQGRPIAPRAQDHRSALVALGAGSLPTPPAWYPAARLSPRRKITLSSRIASNHIPTLPGNSCPYPGCGHDRVVIDGKVRRHCEGHEIQVQAVGMNE